MPDLLQATAQLKVLLPETRTTLGVREIAIGKFPFRVGRQDGASGTATTVSRFLALMQQADAEHPLDAPADLLLPERKESRFVSREHFVIEQEGDEFFLVDCQSSLGTIVEGALVGGRRTGGRRLLNDGDVIVVGSHHSGFVFKFQIVKNTLHDG